MKKILYFLLLVQFGLITAQNKTVVTMYGEKISVNINPLVKGDNGVTANGTIQLGGALIKPTTITTAPASLLEINSATVGAIKITDGNEAKGKILVSNASGTATWQVNNGTQNSLYQHFIVNSQYAIVPNTLNALPGVGPYTAAIDGKYQIIFHSFFYNNCGAGCYGFQAFDFKIFKAGVVIGEEGKYGYTEDYFNTHLSRIIDLKAGDVIDFRILTSFPFWELRAYESLFARNSVEVIFLGA